MVTKTTNPNKIMGVGPFRGFSATHKDLVMETISNVKSSHAFIFMCQLSVSTTSSTTSICHSDQCFTRLEPLERSCRKRRFLVGFIMKALYQILISRNI